MTFQVPNEFVTEWDGGAMLQTRLPQSQFSARGELRLKCVASIHKLYNISSGSVPIWLVNHEASPPTHKGKHTERTG